MDIIDNYSIPNYRLLKRISRSGMSSVYLAESKKNQQLVVAKILAFDKSDSDDISLVKRFIQEYKLLKHLNHPNVANIIDRSLAEDFSCIVMEHFSSGDLSELISEGIPSYQAIIYLRQIAYGLECVHQQNIVHRDIKPRNILVRDDRTLAISDFGIARIMGKSYGLTLQGMILGSPYYMSPEQIDNENIDQRSDIYSLGIVFYEMLTGKKPYRGDSLMKIFYSHLNSPVPSLPPLLQAYQPLINRLLAKRPEDRFQSASELLSALEGYGVEKRTIEDLVLA